MGRFINADDTGYLGVDGTLQSYNLFAYCKNKPTMGFDPTGHFSWTDVFNTAAIVTLAAVAAIAIISSGGTAAPPLLAMASAFAGTTVTASTATAVAANVVVTGLAVMGTATIATVMESSRKNSSNSSQNNNYSGGSTYNRSGERIDFEYNGNGSGNVHYQGSNGKHKIWSLKDGIETTYVVAKAVEAFIKTPQVQKAVDRAMTIVRSLAGF